MEKENIKLIFTNLINGVPLEQVAKAFRKSEAQVLSDFRFVISKMRSYCFVRAFPALQITSISEARKQRLHVLELLEKVNLATAPVFSNITTESVGSERDLRNYC